MTRPDASYRPSWPELSGRVGDRLPVNSLDSAALSTLRKLAAEGDSTAPWLLACSGGADSVLLVLLVHFHFSDHRDKFVLAHFNHALRGEESDEDEAFVRDLAAGLKLSFTSSTGSGQASDEATLREERLAFLLAEAEARGANVILQGHQADDVAETFLQRLSRGAGLPGLCAPRPVRTSSSLSFIRPLLTLSREVVRDTLAEFYVPWREDASNLSSAHLRNRLRAGSMEAWKRDADRDVLAGTLRSRRLLEEADDALKQLGRTLLDECRTSEPDVLAAPPLLQAPSAVVRKALARWFDERASDSFPEAANLDGLVEALSRAEPFHRQFGEGLSLEASLESLCLLRETLPEVPLDWPPVLLPPGSALHLPDGATLCADIETASSELRATVALGQVNPAREAYLALPFALNHFLRVRLRRPGDKIRPLGAPGSRKLKDALADRKVPYPRRACLPLVLAPNAAEILWVPGLPPAENARICPDSSQVIRLTYRPPPA